MFSYLNSALTCEEVNLLDFAKSTPTPFFCYSQQQIVENYIHLKSAFAALNMPISIHYAVKANDNLAIIRAIGRLGAGVDVTSVGEIFKSVKADVAPNRIIFSGIGKTEYELEYAINAGVKFINVESLDELKLLCAISIKTHRVLGVMFRLNLDVDAKTHHKISTSRKGDKFGLSLDSLNEAITIIKECKNLQLKGLAIHIGSQILDIEVYKHAFAKLFKIVANLNNKGLNLQNVDFGGGLGISYDEEQIINLKEYAKLIAEFCSKLKVSATIEPGRYLVANAGALITRVIYNKASYGKKFLIIDAGMNNIIRPTLYDTKHHIIPVKLSKRKVQMYDIVGPVCESSDKFIADFPIQETENNEFLAIMDAGAYCSSMSSNYNARPLIAEYMVDGQEIKMIKRPQTLNDMIDRDLL